LHFIFAQEPSGPEAAAAMAGLEVEVRCYKHVQEATLAELTTALQHLEMKQAKGQGLGSWSSDQLVALRTEVARKQAAEALTQLGDAALEALTRKMNSYHSDEGRCYVLTASSFYNLFTNVKGIAGEQRRPGVYFLSCVFHSCVRKLPKGHRHVPEAVTLYPCLQNEPYRCQEHNDSQC
jgi:hypothetical protein